MKTLDLHLTGMVLTFYYRHIPWTAESFRVGEEVTIAIDGVDYLGEVRAIATYGVDVVIGERIKR
jgi:hypothetical protein